MLTRIWKEKNGRMVKGSLRVLDVPLKEETTGITDMPPSPRVITPYSKQGPPMYVQHKRRRRK